MDATGNIVEQYNFDAWGRRRNPSNWSYINVPTPTITSRGYTGHEHLDDFGLINMNARLYDPVLARMLQPDNVVQAPNYSQSFNRYSYVFNNPLKFTDPTGNQGVGVSASTAQYRIWESTQRQLDNEFDGYNVLIDGSKAKGVISRANHSSDALDGGGGPQKGATSDDPIEYTLPEVILSKWKTHAYDIHNYNEWKASSLKDWARGNVFQAFGYEYSLTLASPAGGYTFSLGTIININDNSANRFISFGPAYGVDASASLQGFLIKSNQAFNNNNFNGPGYQVSFGGGPFQLTYGGDSKAGTLDDTWPNTYSQYCAGGSLSPFPVSVSFAKTKTIIFSAPVIIQLDFLKYEMFGPRY